MSGFFFERLTLVGFLASLVLAVIWPHFDPFCKQIISRLLVTSSSSNVSPPSSIETNSEPWDDYQVHHQRLKPHPGLNGQTLKRPPSELNPFRSIYNSLEGYRQTPLSFGAPDSVSKQRFLMNGDSPLPVVPVEAGPSLIAHGRGSTGRLSTLPAAGGKSMAGGGGTSTTLLTIFTASIIGLIIFTMAKMLNARLLPAADQRTSSSDLYRGKSGKVTDFSQLPRQQRRELLKLSREERVRRLILHHGGRNVSQAMRLLVSELKEQTSTILKSLTDQAAKVNDDGGDDSTVCICSCHHHHHGTVGEPSLEVQQHQGLQRSISMQTLLSSMLLEPNPTAA